MWRALSITARFIGGAVVGGLALAGAWAAYEATVGPVGWTSPSVFATTGDKGAVRVANRTFGRLEQRCRDACDVFRP